MPIFAYLGAGNMASAMLHGALGQGMSPQQFVVYDVRLEATQPWAKQGVNVAKDLKELAHLSDVIILAIKPQQADAVLLELAQCAPNQALLSVMAGVSCKHIAQRAQTHQVARAMPNSLALIAEGASALYFEPHFPEALKQPAEQLLKSCGPQVVLLEEESLLDVVTAVSGSGPAYFYTFMEAMIATAIDMGLEAQAAKALVVQTARGAALISEQSEHSIEALRLQVTSPGGTTEQALKKFQEHHLDQVIRHAMEAALNQAKKLSGVAK